MLYNIHGVYNIVLNEYLPKLKRLYTDHLYYYTHYST